MIIDIVSRYADRDVLKFKLTPLPRGAQSRADLRVTLLNFDHARDLGCRLVWLRRTASPVPTATPPGLNENRRDPEPTPPAVPVASVLRSRHAGARSSLVRGPVGGPAYRYRHAQTGHAARQRNFCHISSSQKKCTADRRSE